jgi:TatD DNase family protein
LVAKGSDLAQRPGVLHSFSGDLREASTAVDLGFKIGVTGPITYKNSKPLQDIVAALKLQALLIETDSPFLPPQPFRGQRNEPAHVVHVGRMIAQIKDLEMDEVFMETTRNANLLFHW